jgi:hypothetical protein
MYKTKSDDTETFAGMFLIIATPLIIGALVMWSAFWNALAGWQLWQWFMIPLGAPDINGYHIAGILMLAHMGLRNAPRPEKEGESKTVRMIIGFAESPVIAIFLLIAGFIVAKLAGLI